MTVPAFTLNKHIFNAALYQRLRTIWFSNLPEGSKTAPMELIKKWFGVGSPAERESFDKVCITEFRKALDAVGPQEYKLPPPPLSHGAEQEQVDIIAAPFISEISSEKTGNADALSLILLLDQYSRNVFRDNQGVIFSHYDRIARAILNTLLRRTNRPDLDPAFRSSPPYWMWFYMPLMHSEWLEDHDRFTKFVSEKKSEAEAAGASSEEILLIGQMIKAEDEHRVPIEKFGRYPYRNGSLGRETTKEEQEWLDANWKGNWGSEEAAEK